MKSGLELGEKQCWRPLGTIVAVQWSAWVYGVTVLAGYRTWGISGGPLGWVVGEEGRRAGLSRACGVPCA